MSMMMMMMVGLNSYKLGNKYGISKIIQRQIYLKRGERGDRSATYLDE